MFRFDQDQWGPIAMTTLAFISPEPAMMTCSGSTRINEAPLPWLHSPLYHQSLPWWHVQVRPGSMRPHCHDYTRLYITRACHDDMFRFDQDQWGPIAMTTLAFISPEPAMMTCSGSTRINGAPLPWLHSPLGSLNTYILDVYFVIYSTVHCPSGMINRKYILR